jgi:hypothetical protein
MKQKDEETKVHSYLKLWEAVQAFFAPRMHALLATLPQEPFGAGTIFRLLHLHER